MKTLLFVLIATVLIGCSKEENHDAHKTELEYDKVNTMSNNTELNSAELDSTEISTPTVVCGMCRSNIRKALLAIEGIEDVKVDTKAKKTNIKFASNMVDIYKIKEVISNAGYDADDVKRNPEAYEKLDDCCKIEKGMH